MCQRKCLIITLHWLRRIITQRFHTYSKFYEYNFGYTSFNTIYSVMVAISQLSRPTYIINSYLVLASQIMIILHYDDYNYYAMMIILL